MTDPTSPGQREDAALARNAASIATAVALQCLVAAVIATVATVAIFASGILKLDPPNAAGDVVGPYARLVVDKANGQANIRAFGGKCDGATDNGPIASTLLQTYKAVVFPADGCTQPYLVNTTIAVPTGGEVVGHGMKGVTGNGGLSTTAPVDTFLSTGDRTAFRDLSISHTGAAGKVFDLAGSSYAEIDGNQVTDVSPTSGDPVIYGYGAQHNIARNRIQHYRPNAYAIAIDSKTNASPFASASVNWTVRDNLIFGSLTTGTSLGTPGPGIHVYSSSGTATQAPQGIYLIGNTIQTQSNNNLVIEQVINLVVTDNTFDIGNGIVFNPVAGGQGIIGVQIHGGYISTPVAPSGQGICINQLGNGAIIADTQIDDMIMSVCGYGVAFTLGNVTGLRVSGNAMSSMSNVAINIQNASLVTVSGNTCRGCSAGNLVLADGTGAANGTVPFPIVANDNQWDPNGPVTITETWPPNFNFGNNNTGKRLAGTAAATVSMPATGCVAVAIPHGLAGVPNPDKTTLTARPLNGIFSNVTVVNATPDATNVNARVCATVTSGGAIRVVEQSSL